MENPYGLENIYVTFLNLFTFKRDYTIVGEFELISIPDNTDAGRCCC